MTPAEKAALKIKYQNRMTLPPAERAAVEAAYAQVLAEESARYSGKPLAEEPSQSAALDAAATEIAPDEDVGSKPRTWRDMTDEEMVAPLQDAPGGGVGATRGDRAAYGERYREAIHNTIDRGVEARQARRAAGMPEIPHSTDAFDADMALAMGQTDEPDAAPVRAEAAPPSRPAAQPYISRQTGKPYVDAHGRTFVVIDGAVYPADRAQQTPEAYRPTDYGYGTTTEDGVEVPISVPADSLLGTPAQFALGDVDRERRRKNDYESAESVRNATHRDFQTYGSPYLPAEERTPEQNQARAARAASEERLRGIMARSRQHQIDNANRQLTPSEADAKARRDRYRAQARLVGGSSQLGAHNRWMADVMLDMSPADRAATLRQMMPINPQRAQMEAVGAQNALSLLRGANLGQGFQNNPLLGAQAAVAHQQAAAARDAARAPDEDVLGDKYAKPGWFGYDEFTIAEQQEMYDDLISRGYTAPEAQAAVDRQAGKRRASERVDWNK